MASQTNVYHCSVFLSSQMAVGDMSGKSVAIIAQDPDAALAVVNEVFGDDVANVQGPTLSSQGAYMSAGGAKAPTTHQTTTEPSQHPHPPTHDAPHGPARVRAK